SLSVVNVQGGSGSTARVTGSGTISLIGANTYAGAWNVDTSTLRLQHADALTSAASITIASGATVRAETASNYPGPWTVNGLLRVETGGGLGVGTTGLNTDRGGVLQVENVDMRRNVSLNGGGTLRGRGAATASGTVTAAGGVPILALATGATST